MLAIETEQSAAFCERCNEVNTLISMLHGSARVTAPRCVLHTATRATFLRRRGHGAPSLRLMGAGDELLGISSAPPWLVRAVSARTRCSWMPTHAHTRRTHLPDRLSFA